MAIKTLEISACGVHIGKNLLVYPSWEHRLMVLHVACWRVLACAVLQVSLYVNKLEKVAQMVMFSHFRPQNQKKPQICRKINTNTQPRYWAILCIQKNEWHTGIVLLPKFPKFPKFICPNFRRYRYPAVGWALKHFLDLHVGGGCWILIPYASVSGKTLFKISVRRIFGRVAKFVH